MSQGIILGLAVAAGLACPTHMWWSHRRGRQAACCLPIPEAEADGEIEVLRARQERLGVLIAEHEAGLLGGASPRHETARK
jgi:hypothetical protein